jgi:transcriptional regulator with XRE-family HTH domain
MSVISKRFADELAEKEMRSAYLSAQTRTKLVNQIRTLRNQRGWSQGDFAKILGKPQSNVSRLENREYGNFSLNTLFELANAFDCGLIVEFTAYEEFLLRTYNLAQSHLVVPSFSRAALDPLCQNVTYCVVSTTPAPLGVFGGSSAFDQTPPFKLPGGGTPVTPQAGFQTVPTADNTGYGPFVGAAMPAGCVTAPPQCVEPYDVTPTVSGFYAIPSA